MSPHPSAFTLVELLVVITIIVVLLSLLAPAMDRAIFQAELAVCGAQHRAVASAATSYAMGARKSYPYREMVASDQISTMPNMLTLAATNYANSAGRDFDDRLPWRGFLAMDAFEDVLSPNVDFDTPRIHETVILTNELWAGWQYRSTGTQAQAQGVAFQFEGMFKIGQRWRWEQLGWDDVRSNVLYADRAEGFPGVFNLAYTSHPDSNDVMLPFQTNAAQGQDTSAGGTGVGGAPLDLVNGSMHVRWQGSGPSVGTHDRNAAYDDGSVQRFLAAHWNPKKDARFVHVPTWRGGGVSVSGYRTIPAR